MEGTTLTGQDHLFSPVTTLNDQQTTYGEGTEYEYTPRNMHGQYHDQVTARYALQRSLNNATIGLASMVGFDRVAALARDAGIKSARGTPSMAIGSYDATPAGHGGRLHGVLPTTGYIWIHGCWPACAHLRAT